jgi:membrane protease YdiL (CAAX protease family)
MTNQPTNQPAYLILLKRHPVVAFFALTYAVSWLAVIPQFAFDRRFGWISGLGSFCPALMALFMTGILEGRAGIEKLLAQLFRWRVGIQWYAAALFGSLLLTMLAVLFSNLVGGLAKLRDIGRVLTMLPNHALILAIIFLYQVAILWGEELGWRGFAQPRLQTSHNALVASVVIGVLWGVWHLPMFWVPDTLQHGISIPFYVAATVGYSVLFAWIYNSTGSVLLATLVHSADNTIVAYMNLFFPSITREPWPSLLALGVLVVLVVALAGPKRLARVSA